MELLGINVKRDELEYGNGAVIQTLNVNGAHYRATKEYEAKLHFAGLVIRAKERS